MSDPEPERHEIEATFRNGSVTVGGVIAGVSPAFLTASAANAILVAKRR